nr:hypothetical protein [Actinoplanes polyasparticus]
MSMLDVLPGSATGRIKTRHNAAYSSHRLLRQPGTTPGQPSNCSAKHT